MIITQELVKKYFEYKEGELFWKIRPANKIQIGDKAGSLNKSSKRQFFRVTIDRKSHPISRVVFLWHHGYLPVQIDHKDRNSLNDKIENLRAATPSQNGANKKKAENKSSKYTGVNISDGKFWKASITYNNHKEYLGQFETQIEAAFAYNEAAKIHHGEFANLNEIDELEIKKLIGDNPNFGKPKRIN